MNWRITRVGGVVLVGFVLVACGGSGDSSPAGPGSGSPPPANPPAGNALGTAELFEPSPGRIYGLPRIAVNESGDAILVWSQDDAQGRGRIWTTRYSGGVWSAPQTIDAVTAATQGAHDPDVAIDASGRAVAVWWQYDSSFPVGFDAGSARAAIYDPGSGWGAPALLESNTAQVLEPRVAMNAAGAAVVVWRQDNTSSRFPADQIHAARRLPGQNWQAPVLIDTAHVEGTSSASPTISIDTDGNAFALWYRYDSTGQDVNSDVVYVNRLTPVTGWSTAAVLRTLPPETRGINSGAGLLSVVTVASNAAVAAWEESDANNNVRVYRSAYRNGAWAAPEDAGAGSTPMLAAADGSALLTLSADVAVPNGIDVRARVYAYTPTGGWDAGTYIDAPGAVSLPVFAAGNAAGRAMAVWQQFADPSDPASARVLYANHFDGAAWSTPRPLQGQPTSDMLLFLGLGLDGAGNAFATWLAGGDGWVNRFAWPASP